MAIQNSFEERPRAVRADIAQVNTWLEEYARRKQDLQNTGTERARRGALPLETLRAQIATHFTPLVESVARRFTGSGEPHEDLVQEGYLGLLSALDHFDPQKGVKFSTYATHFVAGAMRHCLRDRGKIIKEPAWLYELCGKINRVQDQLTQTLGRTPHAAEIASVLNLTEEAVEEVLATRQVFQLMALESSGSGDDTDMAGLVDPEKIRSDRQVTLQLPIEDRIVLEGACDKLKTLEQSVLHEFFYKDMNQTEIAKKLGISCNYVSHILKNSTRKLRRILGEADATDRGRHREGSVMDRASGLYTEAYISRRLEEEISRAARQSVQLGIVYVTLRPIPAGLRDQEDLLAASGGAMRRGIRRMDLAGRCGDDSLIVLLPSTGPQVQVVVDRLRCLFAEMVTARFHGLMPVDSLFGTAYFPEHGRTPAQLVTHARREQEQGQEQRDDYREEARALAA